MIDAETIPQEALDKIAANNEPRVMPGDLLEITVMSYNIDAVRPFNRSSFVTELNRTTSNYSNDTNRNTYYIVDDNGDIEFPVIGKLRIGGMNKSQIQELICNEIYPKYITEKPGVDVRFKNFKVSVIGEVRSPGVYTATNEHLNILEAIALAGDLNITGRRDAVKVIRQEGDVAKTYYIDLRSKNLFNSPVYNLQQNDIVYVEPNKMKMGQSTNNDNSVRAIQTWLSVTSVLTSIAILIFR